MFLVSIFNAVSKDTSKINPTYFVVGVKTKVFVLICWGEKRRKEKKNGAYYEYPHLCFWQTKGNTMFLLTFGSLKGRRCTSC